MTPLEFAAFRPMLRNEPSRVEVARLVLVEGLTQEAAGAAHGLSRSNVSSLMAMVARVHQQYTRAQEEADAAVAALLPPGWVRATVVAPAELVEQLQLDASAALQAQVSGRKTNPARKEKSPGAQERTGAKVNAKRPGRSGA